MEDLPKLNEIEGKQLSELLFEIGFEFEHILYHILVQQKFYQYLGPTVSSSVRKQPRKRF